MGLCILGGVVINLFETFAKVVRTLGPEELEHPEKIDRLVLDRDKSNHRDDVKLVYAPFDHVNATAKLIIVGITPGRQQASNALKAAKRALDRGVPLGEASVEAKVFASFSGAMRSNLISVLDFVGVSRWLGIHSTAALWSERTDLVHFTSAVRYPVFVSEKDWSGSAPNLLKSESMKSWMRSYTGQELTSLSRAIIVPLGPKVRDMLHCLAKEGLVDPNRILAGLPHPSGANAERIAYFLGRKRREHLSAKTNAEALDTAREALITRMAAFS
jgi:hypothetical protein